MLMLVPLAIFLLIAVFLYKGLFLNPSDIGSTMIGKPLPEFSLASLETPERKVTVADFQELPALLNVWATWCPTCKAEHAMLNKLAAQGVVVYGVNYSDAARQWLAQLGNPYRFSVEDPEGSLGINLGVYGAPETFVIDRKGIVRDKFVGAIDERIWRERLAPLYQSLVDEQ